MHYISFNYSSLHRFRQAILVSYMVNAGQDLYSYLKRAGAEPWLDKVNLVLGDNWERELKDAVLAADAFVVCLRPGFDEIGFRQREVRWAMEALELRPPGRGFIIPLIIEPCELPEWCRPFHAGSDRSRPTRFDEVLRAIEKHCNWKSSTDPVAIDESESEEPQELPRPGPVDLELYDRRLRIYKALQKLIQGVLRDATVTLNQLAEFIKDTNEARFLFDRNLSDYLDEVHKQAVRLRYANQRLSGPNRPVGEECSELDEEQARIFTWFEKEYSENARERFSRYLSVEP